jgi:hypothetical protein|tara:strand:- start:298 stop:477 length:180 start_codon:yes stop_codon:yes gene_type:complete
MTTYNHALTIGFEVISNDEQGADITPEMATEALLERVDRLVAKGQVLDAVDIFDTYKED